MTAWLRRNDVPLKPLDEDRMRLVHSYMDADEETARRQAIEERERQSRARARVREVPDEDWTGPDADSAGKTQGKAADESEPGTDDFATAVLREAAKHAARQVAAVEEQARRLAAEEVARQVAAAEEDARRAADEEVKLRVAAALEEVRKEVSRQAAEEAARQVAAIEEQARRLAAEEVARQVAAAAERARAEAAEETVRRVALAEERARAEAAEETVRLVALAEERARAEVAEETARRAATARREHAELGEPAAEPNDAALPVETVAPEPPARRQSESATEDLHDVSGASISREEFLDPAEKAPETVRSPASDHASDHSTEGLPVHGWIHAAAQSDDAGDAPDWTRDLLRIRERTQTDFG